MGIKSIFAKKNMIRQSYHTDLKIQFRLGILHRSSYINIPKSTLYSWKHKDFSQLVGSDILFSDEKIEMIKAFLRDQTLLKAAKGLFFIYSAWISITDHVRGMKSVLRKNRESIVKTIDYV